jgi:hypothetical protein
MEKTLARIKAYEDKKVEAKKNQKEYVPLTRAEKKEKEVRDNVNWKASRERSIERRRVKDPHKGQRIVYGLVDPRTKELFYVGQTINLRERLVAHQTHKALHNSYTPIVCQRIQSIQKEYRLFSVIILELDPLEKLLTRESAWIGFFRDMGLPLLNKFPHQRGNPAKTR